MFRAWYFTALRLIPRRAAISRRGIPWRSASSTRHSVGVRTSGCAGRPRRRRAVMSGQASGVHGELPYPSTSADGAVDSGVRWRTGRGTTSGTAMPKSYARLEHPLVRDGDRATGTLRRATWDEALDRAADRLRAGRSTRTGRRAFGLFSCSKATNELNFITAEVQRERHRQQQHRQLQPHLTRPLCRRSGDRVRGWWRHQLISRS